MSQVYLADSLTVDLSSVVTGVKYWVQAA